MMEMKTYGLAPHTIILGLKQEFPNHILGLTFYLAMGKDISMIIHKNQVC